MEYPGAAAIAMSAADWPALMLDAFHVLEIEMGRYENERMEAEKTER